MSNRHYIKGLRRRMAKRGMGRGMGDTSRIAEYIMQKDKEEREAIRKRAQTKFGNAAERRVKQEADPLAREVAQDKKRTARVRKTRASVAAEA